MLYPGGAKEMAYYAKVENNAFLQSAANQKAFSNNVHSLQQTCEGNDSRLIKESSHYLQEDINQLQEDISTTLKSVISIFS